MVNQQENDDKITPGELIEELYVNREIEFDVDGNNYFAHPLTDRPEPCRYAIWSEPLKKRIFEGSIDELFLFQFPEGVTLKENFEAFSFNYIL